MRIFNFIFVNILIFLWNIFVVVGTGYVIVIHGWSAWTILLALILVSKYEKGYLLIANYEKCLCCDNEKVKPFLKKENGKMKVYYYCDNCDTIFNFDGRIK